MYKWNSPPSPVSRTGANKLNVQVELPSVPGSVDESIQIGYNILEDNQIGYFVRMKEVYYECQDKRIKG